jgi:hypothetical protein
MEDTNIKILFETNVQKQIEEPSIEIREEHGEKIEIKRTIKKLKPVKLAIIKADRKLFKAAEMFYAKSLCRYLQEGLMPYSLVAKRYANDGGPLTDAERNHLKDIREESKRLESEFYGLGISSENAKQKNDTLVRINNINIEISNIQNAYSDIFDSTAEIKARNDVIEWWVLHILYADLDDKGYKCLFGNGSYDDKTKALEVFDAREDAFEIECIKKLSYLISFWFTAKNTVSKQDFESMERLYTESLSEYKVEETEELKITDQTPPKLVEVVEATVKPVEAIVTPKVPETPVAEVKEVLTNAIAPK